MKQTNPKYRQWLIRFNKQKFTKELQRKQKRKNLRRISSQHVKRENKLNNKIEKNDFVRLRTPDVFSIFDNPEKSIDFFNAIERETKSNNPIYILMHNVTKLTIDSIMYLLALFQQLKALKIQYHIQGNVPSNAENFSLLKSSGFYNFVQSPFKDISKDGKIIQIRTGENADPIVAKNICEFAFEKFNLTRLDTKFLYDIIIELMLNTKQHAYTEDNCVICNWYIFVEATNDKLKFIFLDTGDGIPATINKTKSEFVKDWFSKLNIVNPDDHYYIESALSGAFRTKTKQGYRGKGLPKLYSFFQSGKIHDLKIVSNKGYYSQNLKFSMENSLNGSLFYWELFK